MIPFPQSNVPKLLPIFTAMVEESNLQGRSSAEHCMRKLFEGYASRNMDVYADDMDDPKRVIIFGRFPGIVTSEQLIVVLFIFSVPELRGETETQAMLEKQMKDYLAFHGGDALLASDWSYRGAQMGAGSFYRRIGMERQETTYVLLNPLKKAGTPALPAPQ